MTWSYNPSLLASNAKDAVRLLIGDVVTCDQQLQDEEINYFILARGTLYGAAAECCRALAAKFSRSVDQKTGTSQLLYSQMAKAYTAKATEFEFKSAITGGAIPYAGGISISDKLLNDMDEDRVLPTFTKGMHDGDEDIGINNTIENRR